MRKMEDFKASLKDDVPPINLSPHLKALWYDARGDWENSHNIIQHISDNNASWIHAYLHRKEGDIWNANYWYTRAGRTMPSISTEEEWEIITSALLEKNPA